MMSNMRATIFSDMCTYCQQIELFNMINDAMVLLDAYTGEILFMNDKALKLYQYTVEEACKLMVENISYESATVRKKMMETIQQNTDGHIFISRHIKKDGSIFKVEISARYLTLHGREMFVSVIRSLSLNSKMREQVELAGKVQRRLLPRDLKNHLFEIHSIFHPHNYVSGDLYDFCFKADENKLYGILVDVMGHSIAAAAHTGILKYLFMQAKEKKISVSEKLGWINKEVMSFFEGGGFAAVFLFELDFTSRIMEYSSGGINHFIVVKEQGTEIIKAPGIFLGINDNEVFDQNTLHFSSGQSLLFLTDGLFEMISQKISKEVDFLAMKELCTTIINTGNSHDDISAIGVVIH